MFERLALSRLAGALANHAADRQAMVAENVANADTPGYRARDLRPFAELMERGDMPMAVTRAGHQPEGLSAFRAFVDKGGGGRAQWQYGLAGGGDGDGGGDPSQP